MDNYLNLLSDVLHNGEPQQDRTGTGTLSVFGRQLRFDLRDSFPLVTTRRIFFEGVVDELLWFISGSTNAYDLPKRTQHWWLPWADEQGHLGPTYGYQLRRKTTVNRFSPVDQLADIILNIQANPSSRRHVITTWDPVLIPQMNLPPCHGLVIQFRVNNDEVSCQMYQRSADIFVGLPCNIASYALLTHMIAQVCDLKAREFIWVGGDVHLYFNHIRQAKEQLLRSRRVLPQIWLDPSIKKIDDFTTDHIRLIGYNPHPAIKAPVSV